MITYYTLHITHYSITDYIILHEKNNVLLTLINISLIENNVLYSITMLIK